MKNSCHSLVKLYVAVACAMLSAVVIVTASCMSNSNEKEIWLNPPRSLDLTEYGEYAPAIEFSRRGGHISVDWHFTSGWRTRERFVVSLDGQIVRDALDKKGRFTEKYAAEFPRAWPRTSSHVYPHFFRTKDAVALFPYPEFVANAGQWILDDDLRYGLRLVDPTDANTGARVSIIGGVGEKIWAAEFWQFTPISKRLWRISLPAQVCSIGDGNLYTVNETDYVMLAYNGSDALVLSADNGHIVRAIDYNDYLSDVRHSIQTGVPGRFYAWKISFSHEKAMLACGGSSGEQFIVISFADNNQGRLAYACMRSLAPLGHGGMWHVHRMEFALGGKYLVVEYKFAGRGTHIVEYRTEIYDTKDWREVWAMQSRSRKGLILSPNGTHAAMITAAGRSSLLEIGKLMIEIE